MPPVTLVEAWPRRFFSFVSVRSVSLTAVGLTGGSGGGGGGGGGAGSGLGENLPIRGSLSL